MENEVIAPEEEVKETPTAEVETIVETEKQEKTIDEVLEEKKETKMVPEAALIKIKQQNKELAREMKSLKALIEDGGDKSEVKGNIDEIAEEHNIDKKFLRDFAKAVKADNESEIEEKISSRLKPLEEKEKAAKINELFEKEYSRSIEAMPEYKDVANKNVIKALTLNPENRKKTFSQIMEEAYGHLLTGKRTLEQTKARGGNEVAAIDYKRAQTDGEYFKEIMSNPTTKKEYNEGLLKRLGV